MVGERLCLWVVALIILFGKLGDNQKTPRNIGFLRVKVVPPGIEPGTQGFSVLCSTN